MTLHRRSKTTLSCFTSAFIWKIQPKYKVQPSPKVYVLLRITSNQPSVLLRYVSDGSISSSNNLNLSVPTHKMQCEAEAYTLKSNRDSYTATGHSCTCFEYCSIGLPCRHVFYVRLKLKSTN